MNDLFRKEVIERKTNRVWGNVVINNHYGTSLFVTGILIIVCIVILFLFFGSYTKKVAVNGYLFPNKGVLRVYPNEQGTIDARFVSDGDFVSKGDTLLVISTRKSFNKGSNVNIQLISQINARIENLNIRKKSEETILNQEKEQLLLERSSLSDEIKRISEQITNQKELIALAKSDLVKYKDFRERGLIRESELSNKNEQYLKYKADLKMTEQLVLRKGRELSMLNSKLAQLPSRQKNIMTELSNSIFQLEERILDLESNNSYAIKAPVNGRATSIQADLGQSVDSTKLLLTIIPNDTLLYAELYLPSRAIGFINKGQQVLLRYDAFPYQHYGVYTGTIEEVATAVIKPSETSLPIETKEPVYRVKVKIDLQTINANGKEIPLQSGMAVSANILLEKRSLAEWLLAPLYSVTR
ncbi:MAG TPA: HlyD family efflux transporter periplasmic adaptor subunit [Kangiella sp.]